MMVYIEHYICSHYIMQISNLLHRYIKVLSEFHSILLIIIYSTPLTILICNDHKINVIIIKKTTFKTGQKLRPVHN